MAELAPGYGEEQLIVVAAVEGGLEALRARGVFVYGIWQRQFPFIDDRADGAGFAETAQVEGKPVG